MERGVKLTFSLMRNPCSSHFTRPLLLTVWSVEKQTGNHLDLVRDAEPQSPPLCLLNRNLHSRRVPTLKFENLLLDHWPLKETADIRGQFHS